MKNFILINKDLVYEFLVPVVFVMHISVLKLCVFNVLASEFESEERKRSVCHILTTKKLDIDVMLMRELL
jgi:hypothetical protein